MVLKSLNISNLFLSDNNCSIKNIEALQLKLEAIEYILSVKKTMENPYTNIDYKEVYLLKNAIEAFYQDLDISKCLTSILKIIEPYKEYFIDPGHLVANFCDSPIENENSRKCNIF